ncbi:hypothetical protein ACHAP7_001478 [Fusarium lateritium]
MSPEARKVTYNKLLVALGPIFVFQKSPSRPIEFFVPGKPTPTQWPVLPLARCREYNEQETDAVFYSLNHFHLVDDATGCESSILRAFLLSHMSLSFPTFEAVQGQPGTLQLQQDRIYSFKLLRDCYTNLDTLEFYVHKGNAFGLIQEAPGNIKSLHEALSQVNAQLKAITSLKRIMIRFYYDRPASEATKLIQGLGWEVLVGDKVVP